MAKDEEPKTTQLRDYYAALEALQEREQTLLAEEHAGRPTPLIDRFLHSVQTAARRRVDPSEGFHDRADSGLPSPPTPSGELKKTIHFASHLPGREHQVAGHPELSFSYVDREIFPGRRTAREGRMVTRTLDLLLTSSDKQLPVIGELKIRGDSLTYFALVQALMHVAELVAPLQRERLAEHYDGTFAWPPSGPFADLYLIAYEPPDRGEFREASFVAAEKVAKGFGDSPEASRYLRRIAYLLAKPADDGLTFSARFSFPE